MKRLLLLLAFAPATVWAADLTGMSGDQLDAMAAICAPVSEKVCSAIPRKVMPGSLKQLEPGPCQLGKVPYPVEYAGCGAVDSEMAKRNTARRAAAETAQAKAQPSTADAKRWLNNMLGN